MENNGAQTHNEHEAANNNTGCNRSRSRSNGARPAARRNSQPRLYYDPMGQQYRSKQQVLKFCQKHNHSLTNEQVQKWNNRDKCLEARVNGNDPDEVQSKKDAKAETDAMIENAKRYQEIMKKIPIPSPQEAPIPFKTWQALVKSMSEKYKQPLHYLTHKVLKDWDESMADTEEENKPLDTIFPPERAEATIWGIERFYRMCYSHVQLAKLWLLDPTYHVFADPVINYA